MTAVPVMPAMSSVAPALMASMDRAASCLTPAPLHHARTDTAQLSVHLTTSACATRVMKVKHYKLNIAN